MASASHPDDEFHPPTSDDPTWTETCWFTFTVPERRLSGQLYPFFRPNLGVAAGSAYVWDDRGDQPWACRYARSFWHLPIPDLPLSDIRLANGIRYRCVEPLTTYEIGYTDPDVADELTVELTFSAVAAPNRLGTSHLDQPGRYRGTMVLDGERIPVDSYGFRDRSWGPRPQVGEGLGSSQARRGGYSYATRSPEEAFHAITMDFGEGCIAIHGFLIRDGEWARLSHGRREVLERDDRTGAPLVVRLTGTDERGRHLWAEGRCLNRIGVHLNPNLFTWNCLTEWRTGADERTAVPAYGEDHDNWSATAIRHFERRRRGWHGGVL